MDEDKGCCGRPVSCAFTTATGRCKAREEYEATQPQKWPSSLDAFFATFTPEQLERADREARESARRQREQERRQGNDFGRLRR